MKSLLKRLEKLERVTSTNTSDFSVGFDTDGSTTRRRRRAIDVNELEKLCTLQCSDQELALWFGVSETRLQQLRSRRAFRQASERGRAKGRIMIRQAQMQMVAQGNATMARWLGKQILGQGDHVEATNRPVPVIVLPAIRELKADEIQDMAIPISKSRA